MLAKYEGRRLLCRIPIRAGDGITIAGNGSNAWVHGGCLPAAGDGVAARTDDSRPSAERTSSQRRKRAGVAKTRMPVRPGGRLGVHRRHL